jgi:8-oxo-dGTP pyrophosphatase MutT (NUDIX family)
MKKKLIQRAGWAVYWLGWPFLFFYFRLSQRTRVLLSCDDYVLVVSGWLGDGRWSLPGGGLARSEDPVEGVRRELREETGIQLAKDLFQLAGTEIYSRHGHRFAYFQFFAVVPNLLHIHAQRHEIAEARWVDWRTLTAQNATPDTLVMLRKWRGAKDAG